MASISPFIQALGETAYIQTRTLGARNPVTNQPAVTFTAYDPADYDPDDYDCATEISILVDDIQTRTTATGAGLVTEKILRGYVGGSVEVNHLDHLTYHDVVYTVTTIPTTEYLHGQPVYKKIELTRMTQ